MDLSNSNLDNKDFKYLLKIIQNNSSIKELYLNNNNTKISIFNLKLLLETLLVNNSLEKLYTPLLTDSVKDKEEISAIINKIEKNNFSILEFSIVDKFSNCSYDIYEPNLTILENICQRNRKLVKKNRKNILSIFVIILNI